MKTISVVCSPLPLGYRALSIPAPVPLLTQWQSVVSDKWYLLRNSIRRMSFGCKVNTPQLWMLRAAKPRLHSAPVCHYMCVVQSSRYPGGKQYGSYNYGAAQQDRHSWGLTPALGFSFLFSPAIWHFLAIKFLTIKAN